MVIVALIKWLVLLALVLITLPGVIELVMLSVAALRPGRSDVAPASAADIRLAVVIPAHNEESGISATITSLINCHQPLPLSDIHVIADNCSDSTASVASAFGVTVMERVDDNLRGKGYALNFAFSALQDQGFDGFLVVDADTRVEPNFLDSYRELFSRGGAAGQSAYKVGNPEAGLRPRLMHIAFLAFNYLRPLGRHRLGLSAGILGNGFGLSAETLKAVPYDSFSIVEDLEYHVRLVSSGRRVHFLPQTCVWSDMPVTAAEAASQRERWEGGRFRTVRERVPELIRQAVQNRTPRLIEPILELLLMPLSFHGLALLVLAMLGSGWVFSYAVFALLVMVAHVVIAMLVGKASAQDWKTLAYAPFYVLWKVVNVKRILNAAKKTTEWRRTAR